MMTMTMTMAYVCHNQFKFVSSRARMSGKFDSEKDSHSTKFK